MKLEKRKKIIIFIFLMIGIIIISSFGIYYVIEKDVRIEISPTNLINNTIEVHINGKKSFDIFFDEHSLLRVPNIRARKAKVSGFNINVRVFAEPLNISAVRGFSILNGNTIGIGYNNTFSFYQFDGNPQYE
jgi:hypothetical protein